MLTYHTIKYPYTSEHLLVILDAVEVAITVWTHGSHTTKYICVPNKTSRHGEVPTASAETKSELWFDISFRSQGDIGPDPQHCVCHLPLQLSQR